MNIEEIVRVIDGADYLSKEQCEAQTIENLQKIIAALILRLEEHGIVPHINTFLEDLNLKGQHTL